MVITDPIAIQRGPRAAEATGRFIPRLPGLDRPPRCSFSNPTPRPVFEIPLRPRWLGWR